MGLTSKFLAVYELLGSKIVERLLCFLSRFIKASAIILLGNTVSPSVVYRLSEKCGVRVLGVLGELDNPSVAQALKVVNGLLNCRVTTIDGLRLFGYGTGTCNINAISSCSVDILATSKPGVNYGYCKPGNDLVDYLYDLLKPRMVLAGGCRQPYIQGNIFSPGSVRLGYIGVLKVSLDSYKYEFAVYQLDRVLIGLEHLPEYF